MRSIKTLNMEFNNLMLIDRLQELAREYAVSTDFLISVAVERLIKDIEFIRNLRI